MKNGAFFMCIKKENEKTAYKAVFSGADEQIRTAYLFITNEVLYQLSYISARQLL